MASTYIPLLAHDNGSEEDIAMLSRRPAKYSRNPNNNTICWSIIIVLLAADSLLFLHIAFKVYLSPPAQELEYRSPYYGLSDLYMNKQMNITRSSPILSRPRISAVIQKEKPNEITQVWERQWLSGAGTLSPPDRHLRVSKQPEVHTIVQFRTLDFGMEECRVALKLPNNGLGNQATIRLGICRLQTKQEIVPGHISWNSRPRCTEYLSEMDVSPGEEVSFPAFPCPWGTFHTFEVSCAHQTPFPCDIDVWSEQNGPLQGIYMYQYQTLGA